jgi:hypothetical protein
VFENLLLETWHADIMRRPQSSYFHYIVLCWLCVSFVGANNLRADPGSEPYTPLLVKVEPNWKRAAEPNRRDSFLDAATAKDLNTARELWEKFLKDYAPPKDQPDAYSDDSHFRSVRSAKYELVRVYYRLGLSDKGDELLLQLRGDDPAYERFEKPKKS